MTTKLERIAEISAQTAKPVFTSLYHMIDADLLKQCFNEIDGKKAVGIDEVTKEEYGEQLDSNIKDPNILWLIRKYLKAGVMVDGTFEDTEEGTIQGGNISPALANVYMHNVLTLWFKLVVRKEARGDCFLVNYADDFVAGFQYKSDAEMYYSALKERMAKFNLELEESKSRLIEFGRYA
ncbi:Reverse transcriptase (RNA-dependent DNA polymerase) [Butyrivibrio proteoclasticus]|uniref:Reverse transcriptase (RNA-dependent DNA polymerase) n=1 Tax=Butyrivibrio proteoclasticus TaxID=43305 RepID=A0A1I5YT06_9FIRM|nr:reverse transcriptase domain-containing protein [Butyrivibrio proteoclasticus]SFQ47373.1 Reverse transcriptase (RNA-dependent DNA polymerase) [Butyrivibrio proteoclasticus]